MEISCKKETKLTKLRVTAGQIVKKGDALFETEAGKATETISSPADGTVQEILAEEGQKIKAGTVVLTLEETAGEQPAPAAPVPAETATKPAPAETAGKPDPSVAAEKSVNCEIAILGGGPGGYVAAIYAAKRGKRVVLIEMKALGGTCLNVGCIPTKSLVKSSEVLYEALHAEQFGILIDHAEPDMNKIIDHKDSVVEELVQGIEFLMRKNQITVICGCGVLKDAHTIHIPETNTDVHADDIILATGSTFKESTMEGLDLPFVMNSTQALASRTLPKSVTILGGSVTGLEFACLYHNLGAKVHVLKATASMHGGVDDDVSDELIRLLRERGITITLSADMKKVQAADDGQALVTYAVQGQEHVIVSELVLNALGRRPLSENIGLETVGVAVNERKRSITVDSHMRTNVPHIYAIGDVTAIQMLAHVASRQGIVAVDNILGEDKEMDYHAVPSVIFTSPEVASVGITESELKKNNIPCSVSKFAYAGNGKAMSQETREGYVKLIQNDKTGKIVGGQIIGADASTLIDTLALAVTNGMSAKDITDTIFPHPTTGEVIHEAALGLTIGSLHA